MASLQAYQSHGRRYYRIVESFRQNAKPRLRVVAHLGRVEDTQLRGQTTRAPPALPVRCGMTPPGPPKPLIAVDFLRLVVALCYHPGRLRILALE
jgi:hypothetical protein